MRATDWRIGLDHSLQHQGIEERTKRVETSANQGRRVRKLKKWESRRGLEPCEERLCRGRDDAATTPGCYSGRFARARVKRSAKVRI
jgi:hypothetical protein